MIEPLEPSGGTEPTAEVVESLPSSKAQQTSQTTSLPMPELEIQTEEQTPSLPMPELEEEPAQQQASQLNVLDVEKAKINAAVNPKYLPDEGKIEQSPTGAPVVHKLGEIKSVRLSQYPFQVNPDIQRTLFNYSGNQEAIRLLQSGKVPTLSNMKDEDRAAFVDLVKVDPSIPPVNFGIVIPKVKTSKPKLTQTLEESIGEADAPMSTSKLIDELKAVDFEVEKSLTKNRKALEELPNKIKESKTEAEAKEYALKFEDIASKDVYYNIYKKYSKEKDIYPEQISSDIQDIRNEKKYSILEKYGYVGSIDKTLPKNIQNFLRSHEYINSTAEQKKVYAQLLWKANPSLGDANAFYAKIANTFTPSFTGVQIKEQAKELLPYAQDIDKKANPLGSPFRLPFDILRGKEPELKLIEDILNTDFENENSTWGGVSSKIWKGLKTHGHDAIPFLSAAIGLANSVELNGIVNRAKKNGENSLTEKEKLRLKIVRLFNSYMDIAKPDLLTTTINSTPHVIAFFGELGLTHGVRPYVDGLIRGVSNRVMRETMERSPEIVKSIADVLAATNEISGKSLTTLASRAGSIVNYPAQAVAQTAMARSFEALDGAVRGITETPITDFNYEDSEYIHENLPADKQDFTDALKQSYALEFGNIAAADLGKVLEGYQNSMISKVMRVVPKDSGAYRFLRYLKTDSIAADIQAQAAKSGVSVPKNLIVQEILDKAKIAGLPAEAASFGLVLPRYEHYLLGTKDELLTNPKKTIQDELVPAMAGLVVPSLGGRILSIGQLLAVKKLIYRDQFKVGDFYQRVRTASKEEFNSEAFQSELKNDISVYSNTGDIAKNRLGKVMESMVQQRKDFESGNIPEAKGATFAEYKDNAAASQEHMNKLLEEITNGEVNPETVDFGIANASDQSMREQFELHRDLINAYNSSETNQTLREFVKSHKDEYFNIKNQLKASETQGFLKNRQYYLEQIDKLVLPETYKGELRITLERNIRKFELENEGLFGTKDIDRTKRQETLEIKSYDGKSHKFILDENGIYRIKTENPETTISDIEFAVSGMTVENANSLFQIVKNSELPDNAKKSIAESVKERVMSEFYDPEFASDFGNYGNIENLISTLDAISSSVEFTESDKDIMSDNTLRMLENMVRYDTSEKSYQDIRSLLLRINQSSNIFNPKEIIEFNNKILRARFSEKVKEMSSLELAEVASKYPEAKEVTDELLLREKEGTLFGEQTKKIEALRMVALAKQGASVDFELLKQQNPKVKLIHDKLLELKKEGAITENTVTILGGIISSLPKEFIDVNRILLQKSVDGTGSSYSEKSKTITVRYSEGTPEHVILHEFVEELLHSVHHNVAASVASGGIVGSNILPDELLLEMTGITRAENVVSISKWYQSKDYDYNRFLDLRNKELKRTPEERVEYEQIRDMLMRYARKYNQKWDALDFKDTDNKLGWTFTTESLVRNFNRYKEFKKQGYSAAQSHYYSAYSHEYFARTMADFYIQDVATRIAGNNQVESVVNSIATWVAKNVKIPTIQRLFRATTAKQSQTALSEMLSPFDIKTIKDTYSTPDATFNETAKRQFEEISKLSGFKDISEMREHFRKLFENTSDIQALNDFYISVVENVKDGGYDISVADELIAHLNKEIQVNDSDIGSLRRPEDEVRYVSNTLKAIESLQQGKSTGQNWLTKILSAGGKNVEIKRSGLDAFLKGQKSFTKEEILDYLSDKLMVVKDVILGGEVNKEYASINARAENIKNYLRISGFRESSNNRFSFDEISMITQPEGETLMSTDTLNYLDINNSDEININFIKRALKIQKPEAISEVGLESSSRRILDEFKKWYELKEKLDYYESSGDILGSPTRWSEYTTFPLNNYRELLPVIETDKTLFTHEHHFKGIKNQLYHNRLNDVTTVDGKRLLLSEEMQGDWTQTEPRELSTPEELDAFYKNVEELGSEEANRIHSETIKNRIKEKYSPYQKTSDWVRAAIKRMIKMAVDEGKDGIAWTPAHIQVERWSNAVRLVTNKIDFLEKETSKNEKYIQVIIPDKEIALDYMLIDGKWIDEEGHSIQETFGSEIANKIISEKNGTIEGDDIIVGGQGYIDIYDKTAVDVANKLAKKYGLKVESSEVKANEPRVVEPDGTEIVPKTIKVHSLIFNDKLREEVAKQNEIEIFAKREERSSPSSISEFRNMSDMIESQKEVSKEDEIFTFGGIKGFENLKSTNPTEYKRLYDLLDKLNNATKEEKDKFYYIGNFLKGGWFREKLRGKEFKKFEIDDSQMTLKNQSSDITDPVMNNSLSNIMRFVNGNRDGATLESVAESIDNINNSNYPIYLSDIISHKKLFDAYPSAKELKVHFYYDNDGVKGFQYRKEKDSAGTIAINLKEIAKDEAMKDGFINTLLHETQHFIQSEEGFHFGSSPEYFDTNIPLYNTYVLYKLGDAKVIEMLSRPEGATMKKLVDKIENGDPIFLDEFDSRTFIGAKGLAKFNLELQMHLDSAPEYQFAKDLYRSTIGEGEANDVMQRRFGRNQTLPATLLLTLGDAIESQGKLVRPQDLIPTRWMAESEAIAKSDIGAKRRENNPIDVSWFTTLFADKKASVTREQIERVINEVDENSMAYLGGDIKTIGQAKEAASKYAHSLLEIWKGRVIDTELPKASIYYKRELAKLVKIPFRKKISDYSKDIEYIEKLAENANFRLELQKIKDEQRYARNRFLRHNKDNVAFYSAVNNLAKINTRMFETPESLLAYKELLTAKVSEVNVDDFIRKADAQYKEYIDWKRQFNDQYKPTEETLAEDESLLAAEMFYEKKQFIRDIVSTSLVNRGRTELDTRYINEFASVDVDALTETELREYEKAVKYLLLNPESVSHEVVKLANKYKAQKWAENASNELSQKYIDIINRKSLPSTSAFKEWAGGLLPGVRLFGKDKLGNISAYDVNSVFEIAEGLAKAQTGVFRSEITDKINRDYQEYLVQSKAALRPITPKENFSVGQMHLVGIKGLLSQKPQFSASPATLKFLSENGIDIDVISPGELLTARDTDPTKAAAYQLVLAESRKMIKESILLSFGIKPSAEWTDAEIAESLADTSVMSRRTEAKIKEELNQLLEENGYTDLAKLLDDIESGTKTLSRDEDAYSKQLASLMMSVKDGRHSRGVTLKDASEKFYGIEFQEIEDYFPMIRYKTYLTTEKYFDPENETANNAKVFYGIYDDFQMNTSFLEKRKPTVMSLQTNAYEAVRKRMDEQIFYLNHVEQQTYLKSLFRTDMFYGKGNGFNVEASNWIVEQLNGYYNKGINESRASVLKDINAKPLYKAVERYKALYVGGWLKAPAQLSTVVFNAGKLKGGAIKKFEDTKYGSGQAIKSYTQGSEEQLFLEKYAPEVYFRGLNTYDFATHEDSGGSAMGVVKGLEHGIYKSSRGRARNIVSEVTNPYSRFGTDVNLGGLIFMDRAAARISFFSAYKNYCDYLGVDNSLARPNQNAVEWALQSVRETQHTDNPINKSGLSYNNIAGGAGTALGDWTTMNLLAFKSYSINERNTLMKANERLARAISQKNWDAAKGELDLMAASYTSKIAFQSLKLIQKTALAATAAYLTGNNPADKVSETMNFASIMLHTLLDYFSINELAKVGATLGVEGAEMAIKGRKLDDEESKKYFGDEVDASIAAGLAGDIIQTLGRSGKEAVGSTIDDGITGESAIDWARFMTMLSAAGVSAPGLPALNNILREVDKQSDESRRRAKMSGGMFGGYEFSNKTSGYDFE